VQIETASISGSRASFSKSVNTLPPNRAARAFAAASTLSQNAATRALGTLPMASAWNSLIIPQPMMPKRISRSFAKGAPPENGMSMAVNS
jgi:hypothetical protein